MALRRRGVGVGKTYRRWPSWKADIRQAGFIRNGGAATFLGLHFPILGRPMGKKSLKLQKEQTNSVSRIRQRAFFPKALLLCRELPLLVLWPSWVGRWQPARILLTGCADPTLIPGFSASTYRRPGTYSKFGKRGDSQDCLRANGRGVPHLRSTARRAEADRDTNHQVARIYPPFAEIIRASRSRIRCAATITSKRCSRLQ